MAPFPFLQRESLSDLARQVSLTGFVPNLEIAGLLTRELERACPDVEKQERSVRARKSTLFTAGTERSRTSAICS